MVRRTKKPKVCARCKGKKGPKYESRKYCGNCYPQVQQEQKTKAHRKSVAKRYSMPEGAYDQILETQGGVCAICLRATGATKKLSVDHDHKCCKETPTCGKCVRGLLCSVCNRLLGHGRDDPRFFIRAAHYLRFPPATKVLKEKKVRTKEQVGYRDKEGNKQCISCMLWLPETDFKRHSTTSDGLHGTCTRCIALNRYGLDRADYALLEAMQDGKCGSCGSTETLVVDHNHNTGQVRGILCQNCNLALGQLHDDPSVARSLADYAENPPARGLL